jgi:hypothetical protein
LSLYRLCPRRYFERYILPPPEVALVESVSIQMIYSREVIHPGIEALHGYNRIPFNLQLSIDKFRGHEAVSNIDTKEWDVRLAEAIFASYQLNPIKDPVSIEWEGRIKIDDIITGEKNKYQFLSKPDFETANSTVDLKFTMGNRPYPLKPFDDQMLGQAIVFGKEKFQRYQIQVDAKTYELRDIAVEEHPVDDLLRQNWFERTLKTIRDIEESRRTNLWTEHDHACGAFNKVCPYMGSCVFGRVR